MIFTNETPEASACEDKVVNTSDCGHEFHADCKDPDACEIETEHLDAKEEGDTQEDAPDVQQIFMALSSVILNELHNANAKYPEFYHSSNEGLGVIRGKYLKVEDILRKLKAVGSQTYTGDFDELSKELLIACVQLNVATVKAIMSFCDTKPLAERFSHALQQQQQVAEMLHAEEPAE